ncbi:regulatory inactivation of DnaA Hda protein [Paraburkholderia eburnea]|uniref:Regulatory inactivation of DnaA Hda protein n=1 Tax=Paraburkholderia eburnea TaxID=1189126 RepID=A0A2S4MMY3_9BURK|nr:regulatory inactivation of DnaA Hda protein [Paraburkholderia eburnea]PRZ27158.1 regulatory inactivation of DnaA Hda protein [Paraburkholderia eburnea]
MQRQLTLDLGTPPPSTFDNFHTGANAELVARLRGLDAALAAGVDPKADRTFYVWGEPGNGRSHLLRSLAFEAPPGHVRYLGPQSGLAAFTFDPRVTIYAVDDCDALSGAQQIALFNLFNEVRSHPATALVATGNAPPMGLAVREDLRTRLGWGLVFHLAPLSDAGKAAVLKQAARERGINLADDVPAYLLTHFRRDMPSLMRLLDALDRFSLEQKRAVTLPLLRTMLANGEGPLSPEALAGDDTALFALQPEEAESADPADITNVIGEEQAEGGAAPAPDATPAAVELELFPPQETLEQDASDPAYEAPKPPAQQAREPLGDKPFEPPTDNVDGELGVKFRDVVHRELGTELQGEVEADVSNEMTGELNGDLDPPAVPVDPHDPNDPNAPNRPPAAAGPQPDAQADPASPAMPDPAAPDGSPKAAAPDEPASQSDPQPNTQPAPPADAGSGNGFTRFK